MGGNTGNLRTLRLSSNGGRTISSMLADTASSAGGGSLSRMYHWYASKYGMGQGPFFSLVLGIQEGSVRDRAQYYIGRISR